MIGRGIHEFTALVTAIVQAADQRAGLLAAVEVDELVGKWAPLVQVSRDSAVADVLDQQAEFYWEASTLLEPTKLVAERSGEDTAAAIVDSQIRTMREVSARLRRRAAEWRGVSAEDQAIHEMAAGAPTPAGGLEVAGPLHVAVSELTDAYFKEHPELDPKTTSLEFRHVGDWGWKVVGHRVVKEGPPLEVAFPEGAAVAPAGTLEEAAPCCECCAVGDGQCYCEGPAKTLCKCKPCVKARKDMK